MICYVTNTERTCTLEKRILATENFLSSGALVASAVSSFLVNQVQNTRVFFVWIPLAMMKHWIKTLAKRSISLFAGLQSLQFVLTLVDNGVFSALFVQVVLYLLNPQDEISYSAHMGGGDDQLAHKIGVLGLIGSIYVVGGGSGDTSAIPPELICARGRGWFVAGPGLWAEFDHQDLCH